METEDGYVVRNLNSLNGTFVGSSKVEAGERVLSHGDKVHLADSEINFVFRVRGAVRTDRTDEASSSAGSVELGGRLVQRARRLVHQLAEVGAGDDESLGGDGREDQIQEKDAALLGLLESRRGTIVTKEEITRYVWPEQGSGKVPDREILKAVGRIRAEIEEDPRQPAHLITVKGQGYVLL
jgi:DNA-binding response OmpR family regulator